MDIFLYYEKKKQEFIAKYQEEKGILDYGLEGIAKLTEEAEKFLLDVRYSIFELVFVSQIDSWYKEHPEESVMPKEVYLKFCRYAQHPFI